MPPKRRQQDDGRDGGLTGSTAVPRKKVETGTTTSRRSTRAKSNPKLQTYNDIENAKLPLGSEDESDATSSQAASDQAGEQIGDKPTRQNLKRKAKSNARSLNAQLSVGSENLTDADSEQDAPDQTEERIGDKLWVILDNDQRTPLQIGVEAPNRLKLRVQNRNTNEIREYDYKKDDIDAIQNIDWSNKDHIGGIMKWRNQIFNRLKFPIREMTRWSEDEIAFLTLVFEKFALAVDQTKRITLPDNDVIFQLFSEKFGSVHDRGSFDSRIRRKDSSRLAKLKDRLEGEHGDLKPQGGPEYELTVASGELRAYIKHGYVRLGFDLAEYQLFAEATPAIEKAAKAWKTVKRKQKRSAEKPVANKAATGKVVKLRQTRKTTRTAKGKQKKLIEKSAPDSPVVDEPSNTDDTLKFLLVVHPESNIRNDPLETTVDRYDPTTARNKWLSTVVDPSAAFEPHTRPTQSSSRAQQPDTQTNELEKSPQVENWRMRAYTGLHERIERLEGDLDLAHERDGRNNHRAGWHTDYDDESGHRVEGAPAVNALLNSAIVPPVGYHGDVRALVKDKALPADQLRLRELSESALRNYHVAHDDEYDFRSPLTTDEWIEALGLLEEE